MVDFSVDETDALSEVMNISIGRAAESLSALVDEEVTLSVPSISMMPIERAVGEVRGRIGSEACAVRESFKGALSGNALLIFPEQGSLELVRTLVGDESDIDHVSDLEEDALMEVGNIILTSCTAQFCDLLEIEMTYASLPKIERGECAEILMTGDSDDERIALFLEVDFNLKAYDLNRVVLIILGIDAAGVLQEKTSTFLSNLTMN